ncbi:hypothetical protein FRC20_001982 [Serendipita sp. 405]|nr:hypothetical protein FRC20_001982 [Serendipita sp. 405]
MEAGSGDPPRRKSDRRNRDKKRDSVSADSRGIYISFSIDLSIPFLDRSHSIYFDGHFSRLFFADPATTADFHPQTRRKEGKKEERKSENDSTREREIGHLLSLVFTCDTPPSILLRSRSFIRLGHIKASTAISACAGQSDVHKQGQGNMPLAAQLSCDS